nr:MAG TPA: putative transcriptional regulator [Caudoviricetes sp.]
METSIDIFRKRLRDYMKRNRLTQEQMATLAGIRQPALSAFISGKRSLYLDSAVKLMNAIHAKITYSDKPEDNTPDKDVCFIDAQLMPAGANVPPPVAEDYIAAPLVGEVGAGPGYFDQGEVKSWFLAYRHVEAIRGRRNLIAVEIGPTSTSMCPLLNPGDIVLVDRDDKDVRYPGHIMLVRDPDDAGMIKRVSLHRAKNDWIIQFYSDNAAENPPMLYSLREDYDGDLTKAVIGRVIWAWSDVRKK